MKKILILTMVSFALITISCKNSTKTPTEPLVTHDYTYNDGELEMLGVINKFRDSIGVGTVTLNNHVSYKCMEHNDYMIGKGVASHDYFQSRSDNIIAVCKATRVGEIIAYNYSTNRSALWAWRNSPKHDTILKQSFKQVGISIRESDKKKKYYTVIFIK